jgi:hypothetical protein
VLTYFLNDFEMVPLSIITGITLVFTFHIRCISIVLLLLLLLTAIELSLGVSSPYINTHKTNKIKYT